MKDKTVTEMNGTTHVLQSSGPVTECGKAVRDLWIATRKDALPRHALCVECIERVRNG